MLAFEGEAQSLLPHLAQFTSEHREGGIALQNDISQFEAELKEDVEKIWKKSDEADAAQMSMPEDRQQQEKRVQPIDKLPKPDVGKGIDDWRVRMFDVRESSS